ncbi:hypothetical protein HYH02_006323 [Chlamydomonas schloesseri]|uniref:SMP-LTD domain-containing protein n=1 Tax=Chlamydomonas schloesseri TaxID=2026947 RepID=A0A836B5Q4_9CHLO|nr:hypothetical protein HYH02_006323 [Chlamydomonas schloesseri]|eukprot:KAG2448431.1 hypothetical protein HYH02_006323 [Chlamydomonas schloesseri]
MAPEELKVVEVRSAPAEPLPPLSSAQAQGLLPALGTALPIPDDNAPPAHGASAATGDHLVVQESPLKGGAVGGVVSQAAAVAGSITATAKAAASEISEAATPGRKSQPASATVSPQKGAAAAAGGSPATPARGASVGGADSAGPFGGAGAAAAKAVGAGGDATPRTPGVVRAPSLKTSASLRIQESLKQLPSVASDAAKQAGKAYVEAGKEAKQTINTLAGLPFLKKEGAPITITLDQVLTAVFFVVVAFQILLVPLFMPSIFRLVYSLVWGLVAGLGLSALFYVNKKRKTEVNDLLSVNLGLKGVSLVAGGLPSWINMSQKEKMEWLNSLIAEIWPFVDKGICQMIKDITAQVMPGVLKSLPAGLSGLVKSVGFKHLTFGAAPFRVESIWVDETEKERLLMEVSVKWCGDPNITLAIELPTGQKLCPRVMDITFVATIRIMLDPLVDRIPGFVGAMATVPKPPLIKYRLDFGKALGGSMAPAAVTPVVNYFMKEIITKMLVWPQRLVIPILQETEQDRILIQRLMRRHRGVVRIYVQRARQLKKAEWGGTNDVLCEFTTDSEYFESTTIKRARLPHRTTKLTPDSKRNSTSSNSSAQVAAAAAAQASGDAAAEAAAAEAVAEARRKQKDAEENKEIVVWNEYIYLLVQEPKDQLLRMEVFDIDRLRPGKLLSGQVTQVVNGRQIMGRQLIKLEEACRLGMEGKNADAVSKTYMLGDGDWGAPGGPGKGCGRVLLGLQYWPFEKLTKYDVENAMHGIVTIRLLKVWGLMAAGDDLSAFVRVTSTANKKEWRSSTRYWSRARHVLRLQNEIKQLRTTLERDKREGRPTLAARKEKYVKALEQAVSKDSSQNSKARLVVDMDYTLDSGAMHAIYKVKLTDVIKVKVMEASLLASSECLGRLDIPVSDIITAHDVNPLTGQPEYGLHRRKWEEYNPDRPEKPMDQLERGLPLDESDGARIWVELRWVPCIQAAGAAGNTVDEDEEEDL